MHDKMSYGSRFLYAEDLLADGEFKTVAMTVKEWHPPGTLKTAAGDDIDKGAIGFEESPKLLVCNKTNFRLMRWATGEGKPENWIGRKVTLQARDIESFGGIEPAIRVIPPRQKLPRQFVRKALGKPSAFK